MNGITMGAQWIKHVKDRYNDRADSKIERQEKKEGSRQESQREEMKMKISLDTVDETTIKSINNNTNSHMCRDHKAIEPKNSIHQIRLTHICAKYSNATIEMDDNRKCLFTDFAHILR